MVTFIYIGVHVLLVVSIVVYFIAKRNAKRSNAAVVTIVNEQRSAVQLVHDALDHILQSMLSLSDNHAEHTIHRVAASRLDGSIIESTSASEPLITSSEFSSEDDK